uniref:Uncharacterized protein n=1 Tax=Haemonchus contortus TaxID=6289 RepID=A0A7I4Y3P4_HAECO|nr:Hypothetical protein CBG03045 [Haemonchus contortus]
MKAALLFLVVSAIFAFDSRFEYGCGQTSCTFKFIVPENIARFVDPGVLVSQVNSLNYSIGVLQSLEESTAQFTDTTGFNEKFTSEYDKTQGIVTPVTDAVTNQKSNFSTAADESSSLLQQAKLLTDMTNCFQSGGISEHCGNLTSESFF